MSYFKDIYNDLSKEHPNSNIYVISDHHFYHNNIIKYTRNNFNNVEEMNNHIINKHNDIVNNNDIVIFLGDFSFKSNKIKEILNKMNGYKYLVLGNHDKLDIFKNYYELGFENVYTTPVKINDIYLSHEPLVSDVNNEINDKLLVNEFINIKNKINYHGHIHEEYKIDDYHKCVTVETTHYNPVLIGKTITNDKHSILNDKEFNDIVNYLYYEKNIDKTLILIDYIYSLILEILSNNDNYYVYGSYGLYKKYDYISNISDLDVAILYNHDISKVRNNKLYKEIIDKLYITLNNINGINVEYLKRYVNMCSFNILESNKYGNYTKGVFDSNFIPYNIYNDEDFIHINEKTTIEKLIPNININLPNYTCKYLNIYGDISNLLLQIMYQKGYDNKKINAIRKLKYLYRYLDNLDINKLDDILSRLLLKNVLFFSTVNRLDEIDYIKNNDTESDDTFKDISNDLYNLLNEIINSNSSKYNEVLNNIKNTEDYNELGLAYVRKRK